MCGEVNLCTRVDAADGGLDGLQLPGAQQINLGGKATGQGEGGGVRKQASRLYQEHQPIN